ncbi:MAG: hypothetical protein JO267_14445 [Alphaproteobacteria bacterium]|nr:hypothetical protein [Alphaproteobacteria bacterium]
MITLAGGGAQFLEQAVTFINSGSVAVAQNATFDASGSTFLNSATRPAPRGRRS